MNEINQRNIYQENNLLNMEKNPFKFKEISSLKNGDLNLLDTNYEINQKPNRINIENTRKSFTKIMNKNLKELKRFKTQLNIKRMSIKNKIPKIPSNYDNNFILAKKNNLYGSKINNNEKGSFSQINNNLKPNIDIFAKKIKEKFNQNILKAKNYKIITNKNRMNMQKLSNKTENNNYFLNKDTFNNIASYDKNTLKIHKKISNDFLNNYDMNSTMPHTYNKRNTFNSEFVNNLTNDRKRINPYENNKNSKIVDFTKLVKNDKAKTVKQKIIKNKNNKNLQRQNSENKQKIRIQMKNNNMDLSWDYGEREYNKRQNINLYKKSKSGVINQNFYSEKKRFAPKKDQYQNNEDLSDKEIDDIVDKLELYLGNNEKVNKTFIERGTDLLNDSSSLSELADEIVKTYPEQETSDMNFQETVPSTSNPDIDGIFESSNNNVINMNNISYNIPFGNNKGSNSKSYIVNNIYISSPEIKNKNNNLENDINYNFFVVNEYNNTNNNIDNNINNNTNNNKININNLNVPALVTKTYKSPFISGNGIFKINSKDINEIEDSEINDDFSQFKNSVKNNNNQNRILGLNNSNNINNKLVTNNKININPYANEEHSISKSVNDINNFEKENNNLKDKKKLKNNLNELRFSDSILRDILSSHKNTPSNNNLLLSEEKKFNNFQNFYENDKNIGFNQDNKNINYNKEGNYLNQNNINMPEINNIYFSEKNEAKNNIIKNSITKSSLNKPKKHILFNFNKNIYIKFGKDDLITESQVTEQNGEICNHIEKDMDLYNIELKTVKPKPIIKSFLKNEIKINTEYINVENLPERQILPDLYDEFEEQDLKSLEKSLEKSVDKIFH